MTTATEPHSPAQRTGPEIDQHERTERMGRAVVIVTGIRCVLVYMVLPAAGVIGSGIEGVFLPGAGFVAEEQSVPVLGVSLLFHVVTLITTTIAVRRAFRSGHHLRWPYAALGSTFFLFSAISVVWEGAILLSL